MESSCEEGDVELYECLYGYRRVLKGVDCVNKLFSLSSFSTQLHADGVRLLQATFLLCLLASCQVRPALELAFLLEVEAALSGWGASSSSAAAPSCGRKVLGLQFVHY